MSNKIFLKSILFLLFFIFLSFPLISFADNTCSSMGYTIATVNGMNTDNSKARENMISLSKDFGFSFDNQPIDYQYLLNPSHLAGLGDVVKVVDQKFNEDDASLDYDFIEIWKDASLKVKTQKLLLVGHSQGNFYTNIFYKTLADKVGGVPAESLNIYGVASPASYVAGDGKYITSDTDSVINNLRVGNALSILPVNTNIKLLGDDKLTNGHSFSDIYLKYQGTIIISEIKSSLDNLKENNIQNENEPCIVAPEIDMAHKIQGAVFAVADPVAVITKKATVNAVTNSYRLASIIGNNVLGAITRIALILGDDNTASIILASENDTEIVSDILPKEIVPEKVQDEIEESINEMSDPIDILLEENEKVFNTVIVNQVNQENATPNTFSGASSGGNTYVAPVILDPIPTPDPDPVPPTPPPVIPDTTPPVITVTGNILQAVKRNSVYTDAGATANDAVDGAIIVVVTGLVNTASLGTYTITYTATDIANNVSTATRNINVATYVYIPKSQFGTVNGDGNDWRAWFFNSSYVYDWQTSYVNNYLKEEMSFQMLPNSFCSNCLEFGIFNQNPQLGFELANLTRSAYNGNPVNNLSIPSSARYVSTMQWDATGFSYTTLENDLPWISGYVSVANIDTNTYIGWDTSSNAFLNFNYGTWMGIGYPSQFFPASQDHAGGSDMILEPHRVYVP